MKMSHDIGRRKLLRVQRVKQLATKFILRILNDATADVIKPGACWQQISSGLRQPRLERGGTHAIAVAAVADDMVQRRQQLGQGIAMAHCIEHATQQGEVCQAALGVTQERIERRHHVGGSERTKRVGCPVAVAEPDKALRFTAQCVEHMLLLVHRKSPHIAVEHHTQRVAIDQP